MLRKLNSADWQHYIPQVDKEGEVKSIVLELPLVSSLELEVLSATGVTVNLITADGETLFLDSGQRVSVQLKLTGFRGLEILASGLFSYRSSAKARWFERLDPTPMAVVAEQPARQPILDMLRTELNAYMARKELDEELRSEVSVDELIEDIESGDLDFEPDIDEFGLPSLDMQYEEPVFDDQATPPPQEQTPPQAGAAQASATEGSYNPADPNSS